MRVPASKDRADRPKAEHRPRAGPARCQPTRNKGLGSWEVSAVDPPLAVTAAHPRGPISRRSPEGRRCARPPPTRRRPAGACAPLGQGMWRSRGRGGRHDAARRCEPPLSALPPSVRRRARVPCLWRHSRRGSRLLPCGQATNFARRPSRRRFVTILQSSSANTSMT